MAKTRIVMNMQGVRNLLSSEAVRRDLEERATRIADEANRNAEEHGAEYTPQVDTHDRSHGIAAAHVWSNIEGTKDTNEYRTLQQAIDAGRGNVWRK